ncbi:hypothetical protein ANCDUO_27639 [Ancylostoma duodenale]|uniref:Uncharacterized protein n=1 Tax=Ancylostoma duodenale TaxID=51022 RepID=A0A0C2FBH4_9BILA|nr:hypothetical protein ANCDUO_27639 [Ancylostoma duodenale]
MESRANKEGLEVDSGFSVISWEQILASGRHSDYRDSRDSRGDKLSSSVHRRSAGDSRRPAADDRSRSRHVGGGDRKLGRTLRVVCLDQLLHELIAIVRSISLQLRQVAIAADMSPTAHLAATAHLSQRLTPGRTMIGDILRRGTLPRMVDEEEVHTMATAATHTVHQPQTALEAHLGVGDRLPVLGMARLLGKVVVDLQ